MNKSEMNANDSKHMHVAQIKINKDAKIEVKFLIKANFLKLFQV